MTSRTRENAFKEFRWNENVIAVRSEEDYLRFHEFLLEFDEGLAADFEKRTKNYGYIRHIEEINYSDPSCIMFEVKDSGEYGLSIIWSGAQEYDANCDYFGQAPFEMSEL